MIQRSFGDAEREGQMRVADVIARTPKWTAVPGVLIAVAVAMQNPACAGEPSTSVQTEYLIR
jgi:hypothetical protein